MTEASDADLLDDSAAYNLQLLGFRPRLSVFKNIPHESADNTSSILKEDQAILSADRQLSSTNSETLDSSVCSHDGSSDAAIDNELLCISSKLDSLESSNNSVY